jgi:hypothetical protein
MEHCQHSECGAHGAALTTCRLRRGMEHCQHSACSAHGAALTSCWLRRGREHLSAFSVQCAWGSTYILSVEEGKGAFVRIQRAAHMGQHLHPVG